VVFLACRCNQEQHRQQAPSPGKQNPSFQPGPELAVAQEEILEVKLLTVLEVLCCLELSCAEQAPAGELLCVRNALPGEVVAGLGQVASVCVLLHPGWQWDCRGAADFKAQFGASFS